MNKNKPPFPKTLKEFRKQFSTEESCRDYLVLSRWPDGFICPKCGNQTYWPRRKGKLFECTQCKFNISATSGTVMHSSHIPIQEWFWAAYFVTTFTPCLSAIQLQRQIGIGSYRTAWFMLGRLRRAMVNANRTKLSGVVEADETIIGGPAKGKRGRGATQAAHKSLVIGAVEVISYKDKSGNVKEKAQRLRLKKVTTADAGTIKLFLNNNIEFGSQIKTDGWRGYTETTLKEYNHTINPIRQLPAHQVAPHIHRVFSNLKTWLSGTHHGVDPKYLQDYLDEFVFRFNRRQTPMAAFQTLLGIASHKEHATLAKFKKRDVSA